MRSSRSALIRFLALGAATLCAGCIEGIEQGAQQGLQSVVTTFVQELGTAIINLLFNSGATP